MDTVPLLAPAPVNSTSKLMGVVVKLLLMAPRVKSVAVAVVLVARSRPPLSYANSVARSGKGFTD